MNRDEYRARPCNTTTTLTAKWISYVAHFFKRRRSAGGCRNRVKNLTSTSTFQAPTFLTKFKIFKSLAPGMVKQRSWHTFAEPKFGKPVKIFVWKNRDYGSPGQEMTIDSKYMKSWNAVLNFLTIVLQPRFGAVRKLYHLESRKLILCLQDIKSNEKYVAVGADKFKFKKNGYQTEEEKKFPDRTKSSSSSTQGEGSLVSIGNFMAYTKKKRRTVVYFMVTGRACQLPLKVVFIESDLLDYKMVIDYLGYRLDVGEGIRYICTANGKIVSSLNELKHGQLYIVVPFTGQFIRLDYQKIFSEAIPQPGNEGESDEETTAKPKGTKKGKFKKSPLHVVKKKLEPRPVVGKKVQETKCIMSKCKLQACNLPDDQYTIYPEEVDEIVDEVNTLKKLLSELVDETIAKVMEGGIANIAEDERSRGSECSQASAKMTTFADLARQKTSAEPLFDFDLVDGTSPPWRGSFTDRKSISFAKEKSVTPATIFEVPEYLADFSDVKAEEIPQDEADNKAQEFTNPLNENLTRSIELVETRRLELEKKVSKFLCGDSSVDKQSGSSHDEKVMLIIGDIHRHSQMLEQKIFKLLEVSSPPGVPEAIEQGDKSPSNKGSIGKDQEESADPGDAESLPSNGDVQSGSLDIASTSPIIDEESPKGPETFEDDVKGDKLPSNNGSIGKDQEESADPGDVESLPSNGDVQNGSLDVASTSPIIDEESPKGSETFEDDVKGDKLPSNNGSIGKDQEDAEDIPSNIDEEFPKGSESFQNDKPPIEEGKYDIKGDNGCIGDNQEDVEGIPSNEGKTSKTPSITSPIIDEESSKGSDEAPFNTTNIDDENEAHDLKAPIDENPAMGSEYIKTDKPPKVQKIWKAVEALQACTVSLENRVTNLKSALKPSVDTAENSISTGIQKNWIPEEDTKEKEVQSEQELLNIALNTSETKFADNWASFEK